MVTPHFQIATTRRAPECQRRALLRTRVSQCASARTCHPNRFAYEITSEIAK